MPYRTTHLVADQIYHVFNRGVAKQPIYLLAKDYKRFIELVEYYHFTDIPCSYSQFKKIAFDQRDKLLAELRAKSPVHVKILTFCLMQNHFHLLLKQVTENGIKIFMTNLQNGYAKYFNLKNNRVGPLFQSAFKVVRIESEEQLIHVSRYIHLNPSTDYLVDINNLFSYPWSSLRNFFPEDSQNNPFTFVETREINDLLGGGSKHKEFILNQVEYQRQLANIKHLVLD